MVRSQPRCRQVSGSLWDRCEAVELCPPQPARQGRKKRERGGVQPVPVFKFVFPRPSFSGSKPRIETDHFRKAKVIHLGSHCATFAPLVTDHTSPQPPCGLISPSVSLALRSHLGRQGNRILRFPFPLVPSFPRQPRDVNFLKIARCGAAWRVSKDHKRACELLEMKLQLSAAVVMETHGAQCDLR